jgi:hypothetical protein
MSPFRGQLLRQASACQYPRNCSTEIKAQGCVEDLVCGGTRVARLSSERNSKRAAKLKELLLVVPGREAHRSASSNHLSPCSKHHFDPRFKIRKPGFCAKFHASKSDSASSFALSGSCAWNLVVSTRNESSPFALSAESPTLAKVPTAYRTGGFDGVCSWKAQAEMDAGLACNDA